MLADLEAGKAVRTPQPKESTTAYAGMIDKKMGKIDWTKPAKQIEQLIRGLNPWPSAYTRLQGKTLKIWKAEITEENSKEAPGTVTQVLSDRFLVQTGAGMLQVLELQLEGKKRMDTAAFLRGADVSQGEVLGKDTKEKTL